MLEGKHSLTACRLPILEPEIGGEKQVELDRCPSDCGLWLDKGEMQDVIAAFGDKEEGARSVVAKFFAEMFKYEL